MPTIRRVASGVGAANGLTICSIDDIALPQPPMSIVFGTDNNEVITLYSTLNGPPVTGFNLNWTRVGVNERAVTGSPYSELPFAASSITLFCSSVPPII